MSHPRLRPRPPRLRGWGWAGWRGLAALVVWVGVVGSVSADESPAGSPTLGAAVRAAIAEKRIEKGRMLGFNLQREPFDELPPQGAVLVGFDVGLGRFVNIEVVYALRALYLTDRGLIRTRSRGLFAERVLPDDTVIRSKVLRTLRVQAPPEYAVGAVTLRTGLLINGFSLNYMKIDGQKLDPGQTGSSPWVGDRTGGSEATLDGHGRPIVGIFGTQDNQHVSSLGLRFMTPPLETPVSRTKPAARGAGATKEAGPARKDLGDRGPGRHRQTPRPEAQSAETVAAIPTRTEPSLATRTKKAGGPPVLVIGAVTATVFLVTLTVALRKKEEEPRNQTNGLPAPHTPPSRAAVPSARVPLGVGRGAGAQSLSAEEAGPEIWERARPIRSHPRTVRK